MSSRTCPFFFFFWLAIAINTLVAFTNIHYYLLLSNWAPNSSAEIAVDTDTGDTGTDMGDVGTDTHAHTYIYMYLPRSGICCGSANIHRTCGSHHKRNWIIFSSPKLLECRFGSWSLADWWEYEEQLRREAMIEDDREQQKDPRSLITRELTTQA